MSIDHDYNHQMRMAARDNHSGRVEELLARADVDINSTNHSDNTALQLAASRGHSEVVRVLLAHEGVDVNIANITGFTALHFAAERGYDDIVEQLFACPGIQVNARDDMGSTPLLDAVTHGNGSTVRLFLNNQDVTVNIRDNSNESALYQAADNARIEISALLLAHGGIDVNARSDVLCQTALHTAAGHPYDSTIARQIIAHKETDVNVRDYLGDTPLHEAILARNAETVNALLECVDIDVNVKNEVGKTPLHVAAEVVLHDVIDALVHRGANIWALNRRSRVPRIPLDGGDIGHWVSPYCVQVDAMENLDRWRVHSLMLRARRGGLALLCYLSLYEDELLLCCTNNRGPAGKAYDFCLPDFSMAKKDDIPPVIHHMMRARLNELLKRYSHQVCPVFM